MSESCASAPDQNISRFPGFRWRQPAPTPRLRQRSKLEKIKKRKRRKSFRSTSPSPSAENVPAALSCTPCSRVYGRLQDGYIQEQSPLLYWWWLRNMSGDDGGRGSSRHKLLSFCLTYSTASFRCDMERMPPLSVESESSIKDARHLPHTHSSEERLTKAAQELSAATGSTCIAVKADVRDPKQVQTAVQRTIEKYGRIDFVINGHLSLLT